MPAFLATVLIECLQIIHSFHSYLWLGMNIMGMVHTPPSQTLSLDNLMDAADNGDSDLIALKNDHRIQTLRTRQRAFVDVTFEASPVARVMRRDWNILSAKLYINSLSPAYREKIEEDAVEMAWLVNDTADQVRTMPFQHLERSWLRPRRMHVQVVHPILATWLRCMRTLDEVYALLICAEKTGLITARQRHAIVLPSQLAYLAFKCTAMRIPLKTTDELLVDASL